MLLPARTLRREEALAKAVRLKDPAVTVLYGEAEEKHADLRFHFFLHKRRTRRFISWSGEGIWRPSPG